jgi:hypothetical protein
MLLVIHSSLKCMYIKNNPCPSVDVKFLHDMSPKFDVLVNSCAYPYKG